MPSSPIETPALRYATSFLIVLGGVVLGVVAALAVPDSMAYHRFLTPAAILTGMALGVYGMLHVEEGPGVILRRLPWRRL